MQHSNKVILVDTVTKFVMLWLSYLYTFCLQIYNLKEEKKNTTIWTTFLKVKKKIFHKLLILYRISTEKASSKAIL